MANHLGEGARLLSGTSVTEIDNVVPDNIPYEVYNSMADLLLSHHNSAAIPQSQHHLHHSIFFPTSETAPMDSNGAANSSPPQVDWFQQILLSQNQNLNLRSSPFYSQASQLQLQQQHQMQQHNRYDEDSLEMDPLPGDLLHELNLKSEVPPLPHGHSSCNTTDHFLDQHHQPKHFSKSPSNPHKYCAAPAFSAMMEKYGNLGQGFGRPVPPALMDLQPEPSERLTAYASSLLDAVSRDATSPRELNSTIGSCNTMTTLITNGTVLNNRRLRSTRGRKRTNSHYGNDGTRIYQQTLTDAPRLASSARHFAAGAPGSSHDAGELMNTDSGVASSVMGSFVNDDGVLFRNSSTGCFASSTPPLCGSGVIFPSDCSTSRCSSTSSSEPQVAQALTRPSYSEIIKKSSCMNGSGGSGAVSNNVSMVVPNMDLLSLCRGNADGAEQQHLSGGDDSLSSERSSKFSLIGDLSSQKQQQQTEQNSKQSNHSVQRSGQDKASTCRITSSSTSSNDELVTNNFSSSTLDCQSTSTTTGSVGGIAQRNFFDPKRIFRAESVAGEKRDAANRNLTSWQQHNVENEEEEEEDEQKKVSEQFNAELLNNAKCSLGKSTHSFPPPATSFIANDLTYSKKQSQSSSTATATEIEEERTRANKTSAAHSPSTNLSSASSNTNTSSCSPGAATAADPVKRGINLVVPDVHLPPGAALRRSKAAKRKSRRSASGTKVEAGPASRAATFIAQVVKNSVTPYVQWFVWQVLFVALIFLVRVLWVAVAGVSATAGNQALVFAHKALNMLWRRLRPILPTFVGGGGWSGGARHGGRRKKAGSRKPAWMPPGLQANIDLPDTGEDAMKRLLACKEKDAYSVLGVRRDAREEEITHYYRRQALLVHPDKNLEPGAGEAFKILAGAFELVGCPERRREYDAALETARLQSEEAMEQFSDMVTKLQERMEEVMNTLKCDKCGGGHRRHRVEERSTAEARHCAQCQAFHAAREGDLWAEASCLGFRWRYFACMEDGIYNVTDFIACRSEQFKNMSADSHNVLFRLSTTNWRRFKKPQDNLVDLLEDLLPRMGCDTDANEEQQHAGGPKMSRRSCATGSSNNTNHSSPHNSTNTSNTAPMSNARKAKSVRRGRRN